MACAKVTCARLTMPSSSFKTALFGKYTSGIDSIPELETFSLCLSLTHTNNLYLTHHHHNLISQGTYLLLEKCKTVAYRNLFKRVHHILDKYQISLNHVANTFKWLGMPIDLDEVECILSNLIYRGYVRGYLSHAKRILVLSKRDPFPLSTVLAK
jgi:hypothetical protein